MDPSYVQFISSLMGEDAFELPNGRRPSLGGYPGMGPEAIGQIDDCTSFAIRVIAFYLSCACYPTTLSRIRKLRAYARARVQFLQRSGLQLGCGF